jgi:hypothetical protein
VEVESWVNSQIRRTFDFALTAEDGTPLGGAPVEIASPGSSTRLSATTDSVGGAHILLLFDDLTYSDDWLVTLPTQAGTHVGRLRFLESTPVDFHVRQ